MSSILAPSDLPKETSPSFGTLRREGEHYLPPAALDAVTRAYEFAEQAHRGQMRQSGEPYVVHLIATAYYLAALRLDVTSLAAGLLHDTLEDTEVTFQDL